MSIRAINFLHIFTVHAGHIIFLWCFFFFFFFFCTLFSSTLMVTFHVGYMILYSVSFPEHCYVVLNFSLF